MKKTVIVTKTGVVFRTRAENHETSAKHTLGETEGLLRHLVERDEFNVVYFGRWVGAPLEGVMTVTPHLRGLNELSTYADQKAGFDADVEEMRLLPGFDPLCVIEFTGMAYAAAFLNNPALVQPQAAAIRYMAPTLNLLETFELPRVLVNNDVRNYPRCQEMSWGWEYCRPAALFDQTEHVKNMTVGGVRYWRKAVWAKPESWTWTPPVGDPPERRVPTAVVAHCHMRTGFRRPDRAECFDAILSPPKDVQALYDAGTRVYGADWEHYRGYGEMPELYAGILPPVDVSRKLAEAYSCPCVAPGPDYYTNKVHFCVAQGCVPLLYGDGTHPLTWDPLGKYVPLDSPRRVVKSGDLLRRTHELMTGLYAGELAEWRELVRPDFDLIDRLLDDLASGVDWRTRTWWERYGGYWLES